MFDVPYAKLRDLLSELGFTSTVVAESHVLFHHDGIQRRIILRTYQDNDPVEPASVRATRFQLDAWGLLDAAKFDERLRQPSLAG